LVRLRTSTLFRSHAPALILPFLMLSGCRSRDRVEREPPRVVQTPVVTQTPSLDAPRAVSAPVYFPVRRSLGMLSQPGASSSDIAPKTALSFALNFEDDRLQLHATMARSAVHDADASTVLKALGFQSTGENSWAFTISANQRAAFEKQVVGRIESAEKICGVLQSQLRDAALPGRLILSEAPATFFAGTTVFTNHFMDVALAFPQHYIAVEAEGEQGYGRGGRLGVDAENRLTLEQFRLPGEWKRVPRDVTQIVVTPDGAVLALSAGGDKMELGRLQVYRVETVRAAKNFLILPAENAVAQGIDSQSVRPLLPGHLEFPSVDTGPLFAARNRRQMLEKLLDALARPAPAPPPAGASNGLLTSPIVIHADLPWTERHLKALGVTVERTPGRTTITPGENPGILAAQLTQVLQVLRARLFIHEQNIRNAERVRDADNRVNPYRRKILKISPQGEPLEELDLSILPKVSKPGDPNADPDGFVTMPNVNRAVETVEFMTAAEEYRMIRTVMERLAPQNIFPDPIPLPLKSETP